MKRYYMRAVCETPMGDSPFHYHRYTVDAEEAPTVEEKCPEHPTAVHRDLVVEKQETLP